MPLHLVEHLMKQTVDLMFESIRPYMNGDPLFETRIPEIIEIIRKYNSAPIVVFTNATNYHARSLLVNPEINEIHVTISAATPKTYAYVHGRPLYTQAIRTLDWLENHIEPTQRIILHFVITKQNLPEMEMWKQQYARFEQIISGLHKTIRDKQITGDIYPDIDTVPLNTLKGYLFGMPCHLWNNCAVSVHGDYVQCCNSPIDLTYGNITDTPMLEAWRKRCTNRMENESCRSCNCRAKNWRAILEEASNSRGQ
jgi:MoaA/NifB/PqqE/SkfB family radical SAM enzyme